MAQAIRTIDHQEIRDWVEARGGTPAVVEGTQDGEIGGILRVDFGLGDESLEPLGWSEFFRIFDANDLAFVYQDEVDEGESYTCKFVARTEDGEIDEEYDLLNQEEGDTGPDVIGL